MGHRVRFLCALVAGTFALVVGAPTAHAILSKERYKCQTSIAKEGNKYLIGKLKLIQKCNDANLAAPNSCPGPDAGKLQKLVDKLSAGLVKGCKFLPGTEATNLKLIGFPGPCDNPNVADGFTMADLTNCIQQSHDKILAGQCVGGSNQLEACTVVGDCPDFGSEASCQSLLGVVYDSDVSGSLGDTQLKCQKEVSKQSVALTKAVLSNVQKCRNALLNCKFDDATPPNAVCKLSGIASESCATGDEKTASKIVKVVEKATAAITSKCSNGDAAALELCEPNAGTAAEAATCLFGTVNTSGAFPVAVPGEVQSFIDNPESSEPFDAIDYEYAARGICGDNRVNQGTEECDGVDSLACPGQCGAPSGLFGCLCTNKRRSRVVEHANADLDNGWTGLSHDSGIVEGGGYVTDLWDCDGPMGPDKECITGPSCNNVPHQPCSPAPNQAINADTMCTGSGNFCRVTAGGAQGPHCELDFKKRCRPSQNDCPAPDRCVVTPHGAPLPLVSGGVSVCVVNTFSEDVVGTTNLETGETSVRLRQNSTTFTGGSTQQPCPVCGGFCSGTGSETGPGVRNLCTTDDDCSLGSHCITEPICSWGPKIDRACRNGTPYGGPTDFFGSPNVDCPFPTGSGLGTIDIVFNPASTGPVSLTANTFCNTPGFNNKVCAGGSNQHHACTNDSECPGGTCNDQCFCPNVTQSNILESGQKPNACISACLGGDNDGQPCSNDLECDSPNGFCHVGDCRVNGGDDDSAQEGLCTAGPNDGRCSAHPFVSCTSNSGCRPSGTCAFCEETETCEPVRRQCFVNPTIIRQGSPGVPDRTTAATFCLTKTSSTAVNSVAGLSGPAAITNPTTVSNTGF